MSWASAFTRHLLAGSPRAAPGPARLVHGKRRCTTFKIFYAIPFLRFDMLRYTNTYHGVVIAHNIQYSTCCTDLCGPGATCSPARPGCEMVCVSACHGVSTVTKSPDDSLLRSRPCGWVTHDCVKLTRINGPGHTAMGNVWLPIVRADTLHSGKGFLCTLFGHPRGSQMRLW